MENFHKKDKIIVGWREWLALPALGIPAIKAKVDTGARTSALHAFTLESFLHHGQLRVNFGIHPLQKCLDVEIFCQADVVDQRIVSDSGGHTELRYVIQTDVCMHNQVWTIEVTLTNRDTMNFRMLLGRTAMNNKMIVDPSESYLLGEVPDNIYIGQKACSKGATE